MCADGQHFGLNVIANIFRTIGLPITSYDVHSRVSSELMNDFGVNFSEIQQRKIIMSNEDLCTKIKSGRVQLVSPDKGSLIKTINLSSDSVSPHPVAIGNKKRNTENGNIDGFDVNVDNFDGHDLLIVDDICDGGGTFIGLAKVLKERNCGDISLYVTHGIFSKGFDSFTGLISHIYTSDSFRRISSISTGTVAKNVKLTTIKI